MTEFAQDAECRRFMPFLAPNDRFTSLTGFSSTACSSGLSSDAAG